MKLVLNYFVLCLIVLISIRTVAHPTEEAYVTLLYGDEFLLGVRVLGKSIRDSGSNKDMVVLASDGVSDYTVKLLEADGWIIEKISLLSNPNQVHPSRFWGVYTKLKIFNMTTYKKVVYLDADTIVVKSTDNLFKCSKFCANLKHSERLNSGVMVVEPSEALFNDMMSKVNTLASYTGGDQGFLNSYYSEFPNARVFDPNIPLDVVKSRPAPKMERLSTVYNADVGLYMVANKWMVDESELHVIHYTLGPFKPWDWWTSWIIKPVDVWLRIRGTLEESLPGTRGGRNPKDELIVKFLFLLPIFATLLCWYRSILQVNGRSSLCNQIRQLYIKVRSNGKLAYASVSTSYPLNSSSQFPNGALSRLPVCLNGVSIFVCFMAAVASLGISLAIVPRQVMPWTGLVLMYEWTFTIFFCLFGGFLHLVYLCGKSTANQLASNSLETKTQDYDSGKGHQRQVSSSDVSTLFYGFGMAFLSVAAPSLPCIFGITALFLRLGLMIVGGLFLASFMTHAAQQLAIRSFVKGFEDFYLVDTTAYTRTNMCLLC